MKTKLIFPIGILFIIGFLLVSFSSIASGCSVSISGITQQPSEESWPYWAEGNVTSSISFDAPENVTFYHFTSALSTWSETVSPQWVHIGGCSPLDFGDFSGNLPENPFEWYIGYLNDGTYKLEVSLYCEYLENTTSYNCTSDTETIFSVSTIPETNNSGSLTADFTWTPDQPTIFEPVQFQSTSQVTNGYITKYQWYLDGVTVSTGAETWEWSNPTQGSHTIELEVTDSNLNTDSISFSFEVTAEEWFVIDAKTGKNIQETTPWDLVEPTTSFQYGDDIIAWAKIGNITKGMTIDYIWTDPDFSTIRSISKNIDDPNSYGYSMWESYVVWDNITVGDPLYETIFSQPGDWYVTIYIDGSVVRVLDFTVASDRILSISVDKTHVITGEEIVLSGSVTDNSIPVDDTTVDISIYRMDTLQQTHSDILLDDQGSFSISYIIPIVEFSEDHIEDWSFSVSTDSTNPSIASIIESISFQVLPVYLELVDVKLVQIIETPVFSDWGGSYPYLALNRPAAIRVILTCPYWTSDFKVPEVTISFTDTPFTTSSTIIQEQTVQVTNKKTNHDFSFTPSIAGSHHMKIQIDPYHDFSLTSSMQTYIDGLSWEDEVISKEMKTLMLKFIPVDIPTVLDDPSQLVFLKRQMDFIRDVYPIPKNDIDFRCCYRYDTLAYERTKWTLLNMLATKNLIGNYGNSRVVLVGVTPQNWWDPGDEGMALGRYITSAVLIKNNSDDVGVTAHEVGHTMGLRTWTEEYDLSNYYTHRYLSGLIQKDGNIINISNADECRQAFPYMLRDVRRTTTIINFYCMMGNSRYSWICEEDYIDLFKALKDPPNTQSLLVNGWIHANGSVSIGNCYLFSESSVNEPFNQGEYTIEVISTTNEVLYADTFGKKSDEDDPFSFSIPWYDDASYVHIRKENDVLDQLSPSAHQPQVTIIQPTDGIIDTDRLTVSWQGSDADGDDLSYTVFYSHDGSNWDIINSETTNTSVEIKTKYLAGGSSCRIKIMVTDGFYMNMAESALFSIDKKQPVCIILDEENTSVSGIGYDPEDGALNDSDLSWYSDIQGFVGLGDQLPEDVLTVGSHLITMKATDSDGNTAENTTTVIITSQKDTAKDGVTHVFCLDVDEYGSAIGENKVFSTDETVYSLITFDNVSVGDQLRWIFTGPNQQTKSASLIFESSGTMYGFSPLDLKTFDKAESKGEWQVDIYLNDVFVLSDSFTITEKSDTPFGIEILFFAALFMVFWLKRKEQ